MGTREKLFRQKLANQIEAVLTNSEKVFTTEKLTTQWIETMLADAKELTSVLTIYQFLHDLPENEKLQIEFLELKDEEREQAEPKVEIPNYGTEILKEIEEFETQESVEVFETVEQDVIIEETIISLEEEVTPSVTFNPKKEVEQVKKEEELTTLRLDKDVAQKEINDTVSSSEPSLADKLSKNTIKKLADSIALNERFLFSNELFNGNMEAFKRALSELDHIESKTDALKYIEIQLKEDNQWDMESETAQQFISLIERRFH